MRIFGICLILLFFSQTCSAQREVKVVVPNGDTSIYVPQTIKTIAKTKHDTVQIVVHDTITRQFYTNNVLERDIEIQPVYMDVAVTNLHDTIYVQEGKQPQFGLFGEADFHSAIVAPSLKIKIDNFDWYIFMGAYYNSTTHNSYFTAGASAFAKF